MKQYLFLLVLLTLSLICWGKPLTIFSQAKSASFIDKEQTLAEIVHTTPGGYKAALLVGADSTAVGVTEDAFSHIHLLKDKNNGWIVQSDSLPPVVNIRNVKEVYLSGSTGANPRFVKIRNAADFLGQSLKNGFLAYKYRLRKGV
jgi:hypothetical protein